MKLNIKRRERIREILQNKGEVSLRELGGIFTECSVATLRRDLKYLEDEGVLKRTRGGAIAINRTQASAEGIYLRRRLEYAEAKSEVAKKAAAFLKKGHAVYFDSGTAIMQLASEMPDEYFSVLTSGPGIALEIVKKHHPAVTLIGGQLNRNTFSVSGANSVEFIKKVNIDVAFMAASGFSHENGFTGDTPAECELKREVIKRAKKRIMLMVSAKLGRNMPFTFAGLKDIDILVTDSDMPVSAKRTIESENVKVI